MNFLAKVKTLVKIPGVFFVPDSEEGPVRRAMLNHRQRGTCLGPKSEKGLQNSAAYGFMLMKNVSAGTCMRTVTSPLVPYIHL